MSSLSGLQGDSNSISRAQRTLAAIRAVQAKRKAERETTRSIEERLYEVREKCLSFRGFMEECWHVLEPTTKFIHEWHNDVIADHMQAVHHGEIQRLQINVPPG